MGRGVETFTALVPPKQWNLYPKHLMAKLPQIYGETAQKKEDRCRNRNLEKQSSIEEMVGRRLKSLPH